MVYARGFARGNGLRGTRFRPRRGGKRTYTTRARAKVRYQAPTARNQRGQIARNTVAIDRLRARQRRHWVYTDYQLTGQINPSWNTFLAYALTDPSGQSSGVSWMPVLRQDQTVVRGSHTFCKRMQLNFRCNIGSIVTAAVYFNVFILRPRWSDTQAIAPTTANEDFIDSAPGANVRVNSAKYKVVASKYFTLSHNSVGLPGPTSPVGAGNPFSTYRKWQWNIPLNFPITNPAPPSVGSNATWLDKNISDLPYWNRYYVVVYCAHEGTSAPGGGLPFVSWDCLFTCTNSD